jgi:hypothetical protein
VILQEIGKRWGLGESMWNRLFTHNSLRKSTMAVPQAASFSYLNAKAAHYHSSAHWLLQRRVAHIPLRRVNVSITSLQSPDDGFVRLIVGHLVDLSRGCGEVIRYLVIP